MAFLNCWLDRIGKDRLLRKRHHIAQITLGFTVLGFLSSASIAYTSNKPSGQPAPELFASGVISTDDDEFGGTFTPDGKSFYFVKRTQATIRSNLLVICVSHFQNGKWNEPEIAPFSGVYKDLDPFITPDGSKLFFVSTRPIDDKPRRDTNIWFIERTGTGWSEPKPVGPPLNSDFVEFSPSVTRDGTIYFTSNKPGGLGSFDIYRSRLVQGKYTEPEDLGPAVNSLAAETSVFIAPDESFLLFASQNRDDALAGGGSPYPRSDLYLTRYQGGNWTTSRHLPSPINSTAEEANPFVSPDGKYLYFSSERGFASVPMKKQLNHQALVHFLHQPGNGLGDIYRVAFSAIEN